MTPPKTGIFAALELVLKTMPFVLLRMAVLIGFSLAGILWFAMVAFFAGKSEGAHSGAGPLVFIAFIIPIGFFFALRRYVLHLLAAAHVACLTDLIMNGKLPEGDMIAYGKKRVKDEFTQVNVLYLVDALVAAVVRQFHAAMNFFAAILPIPGLRSLANLVDSVMRAATTYMDEAILSYNFSKPGEDVWVSARDGLILYAQNSKTILKTAVWSLILDWGSSIAVFIFCLAPAAAVMHIMSGSGGQIGAGGMFAAAIAVLFAISLRMALIQPICLTMILLSFHACAATQTPDPEWQQKLMTVSSKFRELCDKIKSGGLRAPQAPQVSQGAAS